ncbi:amidase family protein [Kribbella shirazensis]|uniref:Aspartyl-tRNA(Asn)/glutamyl-tRNA(Gln) amidotransferase subunit A n=1 Tax=Kribbella shirazensis TaxID=1105143 RepID=A0A7X6A1R1_9ACTN|nr:aspartyl-tRNA(Asn)/glutamyl-tRNA(Gln) amidotransferase subunit A [Kribbella shirazensis]
MTSLAHGSDVVAAARAAPDVFLQVTSVRAEQDGERAATYGGPLAGVPYAVKDVFDLAGTRTSGASRFFDGRPVARQDAEAVRRIAAAGGVCIGKTTLSELAYSGLGVNDRFGTPTLQRDGVDHIVGGSSSGSAAAVQAGIVPVALGSDTSGSARIPAAWTGIFGFRPSLGRYPDEGMLPLAPTLDTVGILAADAATLLTTDAVLAADPREPGAAGPTTFVLPHDEYLESCDSAVLERFHATIDRLRSYGVRFERRRVESLDITRSIHAQHLAIVEEEALAAYGRHFERNPELFGAPVRRRLERARTRARERSAEPLRQAMPALRAQYRRELGDAILVSPPVEIDAPTLEQVRSSPEAEDALNARALRLTMALSYLDSPSAVMPAHTASLQLSATSGEDHRVLTAVAHFDTLIP